jgi:hypothetical protein
MMTQARFSVFDGFIETGFEQRFQGLLRQAWRQRSWHVIVAEPGSGKSMGIRDLVLTSTGSRSTMSGRNFPVLAVTASKNDPKEQALGDNLMQAMSLPTRGRWREQKQTLLYVLKNYGVECVIIDDAHDLSMQHLIFLKEITDQLLLPPNNHALGLCLVTAGGGGGVPLKDILDQPEMMWMQFRRRLDRVQPYCQIANHTRDEVQAILATLERVYQAYFPALHLQKWTGAIYTWLTNPLLDPQVGQRVNMDHLMKLVTTALEWTYAEAKMDVTAQTLEAAAQLLMVQHKSVYVIDALGAKKPQTPSKEETPTETSSDLPSNDTQESLEQPSAQPPVPRPKKRKRAQASLPETGSDLPVSDKPSTKNSQTASKEEVKDDPPVPRPKRRRRVGISQPEMNSDLPREASG